MQKTYKYENDEIRFLFSFSEKEAYVLMSIMQKSIQSDSHLWQRLASNILDSINDGFKNYQDKVQEMDTNSFNKEYECSFIS